MYAHLPALAKLEVSRPGYAPVMREMELSNRNSEQQWLSARYLVLRKMRYCLRVPVGGDKLLLDNGNNENRVADC
jgi:hypothetical protein